MPQLILEYTENVLEKTNLSLLFKKCHEILTEKLPADLGSCKSRAIEQNDYYIGDGRSENAFVSLHIKVMAGRSLETLNEVAQSIMRVLKQHFDGSLKQLNLQITLELQELSHSMYFKVASV